MDDFSPAQQAAVIMENYDPAFKDIVRDGDILVGGFNFGTGSSREQAATSLKYRRLQLVIAGSFSETYKRNAINNGFLALESPDLVHDLRKQFGIEKLTLRTGQQVEIDFRHSMIRLGTRHYDFSPIGTAAQELIVFEGLENWVKNVL
jgi:homoaconitate hydratase